MNVEKIAVLKVNGCGLVFGSRQILDAIALAASEMLIGNSERKKIRGKNVEGLMTTEGKLGFLRGMCGHVFNLTASFEGINGDVSLDFLLTRPVTEEFLLGGIWSISERDENAEKACFN